MNKKNGKVLFDFDIDGKKQAKRVSTKIFKIDKNKDTLHV